MITIAQYLQQRRSFTPDQYIAKVELLDYQENTIDDITKDVMDGSININLQNGSRRSASITLSNKDKIYNLSPTGKLWLDTKFKLSTGIRINGEDNFYSQGVYILGEPNETSSNSSGMVSLELYDKFSLLDGTLSGTLLNSTIIPLNTNINNAMGSLFSDANTNQKLLNYLLKPLIASPSINIMPYTLRIDEGGTTFEMMTQLADAFTKEIYYDAFGFPRFEDPTNYDNEPTICYLSESDRLKIGMNKQYEISNVKNAIRIVGGNYGTGEIFDASASDTNILSPMRIDRIGKRELYIQDDIIYTTALAQLRADYELKKAMQAVESISIECIPLDFMDVGKVISLTDARLGINNERYLVKQITMPLFHSGSTMTMSVWRLRAF